MTLLEIRGVSHSFGDVMALDDVSIDIGDNEFFALLGPSGSGKTTLLRSIAGFERPTAGSILLDGNDLLAMPPHRRPVNLMFQSYALFPHLSVERNVAYGLQAEGLKGREVRQRVAQVLETVGLAAFARRRPSTLSGGQRQRVALARAIVKRPRLLLLDEPLSALDQKVRSEMQLELKRMQHEVNMTFVVVTHDQEEAMSMADRIAVLDRGKVEQLGTPLDLYSRPATRFVADFLGRANMLDGTSKDVGVDVPGVGHLIVTHELPAELDVTVVVRPEDSMVVPPHEGSVTGVVADTYFLGGSSTVSIRVAGLDRPVTSIVHSAVNVRRGETVGVRFDLDRAVVVRRD